MEKLRDIQIYNTLSRRKEVFKPVTPGMVGLYVCGPTVYGDAHLGHARPGVTYDVLVRLFRHLGYKVRYVRNITDVGHLESDSDAGEDKIAKKARLEQLEPMEVVQYYTLRFHEAMKKMNNCPPSIEPRASGHIIEQIALVQEILKNGYAYESNGSVYFDVRERIGGKSKYSTSKMVNLAIDGITSFSTKPLRLITILGIIIIIMSICAAIYIFTSYTLGVSVPGWSSILLSIWFLGGVLVLILGVIGEYVGKIYKEVKRRPKYHIDRRI